MRIARHHLEHGSRITREYVVECEDRTIAGVHESYRVRGDLG